MSSTLRLAAKRTVRVAQRTSRPSSVLTPSLANGCRRSSTASWVRSNSRISTLFTALIAVGAASTAYGLYEFYKMFTMWPEEVRGDLRAGVKAKHQGDYTMSERFFRRAWDTARALPLEKLGADPYLKLSGIGIALAEVLELAERPAPAYDAYVAAVDAFTELRGAGALLSGAERMRAVALASKLGAMAEAYQLPLAEEERWLSWAVTELMHVLRDARNDKRVNVDGDGAEADALGMLSELELPAWVSRTELGAPLEALGGFYARAGNVEYAVPLYLQAINLLVPPAGSGRTSTTEEKCRGAQLMNNLAELTVRDAPTPEGQRRAELWARQAKGTIERAKSSALASPEELATCEQALAAVMYNLGSLLEMRGESGEARDLYQQSWEQANRIKMREGTMAARAALRRLDRATQKQAQAAATKDVSA